MTEKEIKYRAGAYIIGSLFWDDDHGRTEWRQKAFDNKNLENPIKVPLPLRYGRYSRNRDCPTMVFSNEYYKAGKLGTGLAIPFKGEELTVEQILYQAHEMSNAEGENDGRFLKGNVNHPWCTIVCWINPSLNAEKKSYFLEIWTNEYENELRDELRERFKMEFEEEVVFTENGELIFDWPDELNDLDVVIATQTRPSLSLKDNSRYATSEELITAFVRAPEYFINNINSGILTSDDELIRKGIDK